MRTLPKVLVLEDYVPDVQIFKIVSEWICNPFFTCSIKEACALLKAVKFDAVFIDQFVSGGGEAGEGVEVLLFIKENNIDIKKIIISGVDSFSTVMAARFLSADMFIEKPITKETLKKALAKSS